MGGQPRRVCPYLAEGVVIFLFPHGRGGAVAGKQDERVRERQETLTDAAEMGGVEGRRIRPPDRAGEEGIADEHALVSLVAHPTRRVAWGRHQSAILPADLKR